MSTINDDYYNSRRKALPIFIKIVKLNDNELYSLGEYMTYEQRVLLDYEIDCIKKGIPFYKSVAMVNHEEKYIDKLIKYDELDFIINHIAEIFRGKHSLNEKVLDYLKSYEDLIFGDTKEHIEMVITKCLSSYYIRKDDEELKKLHKLLVSVAEEENTSLFSIRKFQYGAYSTVYRINDKVIKIGYRECESIPNCSEILLPDFKGKIGSDYIEITDYAPTLDDADLEELYTIYQNLRNQGLIWLDPRSDNVARLSEKTANIQNQKRKGIHTLDIDFNPAYHMKELQAGDLVIIDLDHIVFQEDQDTINAIKRDLDESLLDRIESFEKRYQEEKQPKKLYKS